MYSHWQAALRRRLSMAGLSFFFILTTQAQGLPGPDSAALGTGLGSSPAQQQLITGGGVLLLVGGMAYSLWRLRRVRA